MPENESTTNQTPKKPKKTILGLGIAVVLLGGATAGIMLAADDKKDKEAYESAESAYTELLKAEYMSTTLDDAEKEKLEKESVNLTEDEKKEIQEKVEKEQTGATTSGETTASGTHPFTAFFTHGLELSNSDKVEKDEKVQEQFEKALANAEKLEADVKAGKATLVSDKYKGKQIDFEKEFGIALELTDDNFKSIQESLQLMVAFEGGGKDEPKATPNLSLEVFTQFFSMTDIAYVDYSIKENRTNGLKAVGAMETMVDKGFSAYLTDDDIAAFKDSFATMKATIDAAETN